VTSTEDFKGARSSMGNEQQLYAQHAYHGYYKHPFCHYLFFINT